MCVSVLGLTPRDRAPREGNRHDVIEAQAHAMWPPRCTEDEGKHHILSRGGLDVRECLCDCFLSGCVSERGDEWVDCETLAHRCVS